MFFDPNAYASNVACNSGDSSNWNPNYYYTATVTHPYANTDCSERVTFY